MLNEIGAKSLLRSAHSKAQTRAREQLKSVPVSGVWPRAASRLPATNRQSGERHANRPNRDCSRTNRLYTEQIKAATVEEAAAAVGQIAAECVIARKNADRQQTPKRGNLQKQQKKTLIAQNFARNFDSPNALG